MLPLLQVVLLALPSTLDPDVFIGPLKSPIKSNQVTLVEPRNGGVQGLNQSSKDHGARPWGIAVHRDRIYWSTAGSNKLESSTKTGSDIRLHHTDDNDMNRIAVVPNFNLTTGRTNHCEGHSCSNVCVLTATSYKCIQ